MPPRRHAFPLDCNSLSCLPFLTMMPLLQVSVLLNTSTHLKLNFTASAHDPLRHDLASSPFFSFVLTIVLIALIYYHKWVRLLSRLSR